MQVRISIGKASNSINTASPGTSLDQCRRALVLRRDVILPNLRDIILVDKIFIPIKKRINLNLKPFIEITRVFLSLLDCVVGLVEMVIPCQDNSG